MLQSMLADNPIFEISYLEIDRPGPHYAIDTVRLLAEKDPSADIILLIGGDSLSDLPNWRFSSDLVTAVSKIGVMRRPGLSTWPRLKRNFPLLRKNHLH